MNDVWEGQLLPSAIFQQSPPVFLILESSGIRKPAELIGKKVMLSEMGYQVTSMISSVETLELFKANADHFDLVVTDQTVPELSGKEIRQKLLQLRPDLATILCPGFSNKVEENAAKKLRNSAFCMKPLNLPELVQTVRRVLDAREVGMSRGNKI
ncbi:MAG: response regulator [Desulfuromusa sp.]|nr:response regulator [Desulfuromusa sp.]